MNEANVAPPTQEEHSGSQQVSSEDVFSVPIQEVRPQAVEVTVSTGTSDGQEAYERGTALKNVGLFRQAAGHFEKAAQDLTYAL